MEYPRYGDLVERGDDLIRITDPEADGSSPPMDWEDAGLVGGCSLGEPWLSAWGMTYS